VSGQDENMICSGSDGGNLFNVPRPVAELKDGDGKKLMLKSTGEPKSTLTCLKIIYK
jgi:hypothetical protein